MVDNGCKVVGEIKWEVRPRGMLVQKREDFDQSSGEIIIKVRVSTGSQWHGISIEATPTFQTNSNGLQAAVDEPLSIMTVMKMVVICDEVEIRERQQTADEVK
ncbi:hypothetical protein Syun_031266 [Stephania yunnanensis]|uniref:Uncharacterized protein n=1 Tax=Stephania yunnanensis TaxID=152371 RepID=A0AAP0DU55_9MAGN